MTHELPTSAIKSWQLVATITQDVRAHCPVCDDWNEVVEDLVGLLDVVAQHTRERHPDKVIEMPRLGHSFASPNWEWSKPKGGKGKDSGKGGAADGPGPVGLMRRRNRRNGSE